MKHPGISPSRRPHPSREQERYKALTLLMQGKSDEVKRPRKKRGADKQKRRQDEAILRNEIIKELRNRGVVVMRVENAIIGKHNTGFGDLWIFNKVKRLAGWMEIKTPIGILTGKQPEFKELCALCGVHYWIVRSVVEAVEVIG